MIKEKQITVPAYCCEICEKEAGVLSQSNPFHKLFQVLSEMSDTLPVMYEESSFCICKDCQEKYGKAIAKVLLDSFNDTVQYIKQNQGDK